MNGKRELSASLLPFLFLGPISCDMNLLCHNELNPLKQRAKKEIFILFKLILLYISSFDKKVTNISCMNYYQPPLPHL